MGTDWFGANRRRIIQFLLIAGLILLLIFARQALVSSIKPFLYALILAYLFNPLVNFAQKKGIKRWISSLLIVLVFLLLMVFFGAVLLPSMIKDVLELIRRMPSVLADLKRELLELLEGLNAALAGAVDTKRAVDEVTNHIYQGLMSLLTGMLSSLGGLFDILLIPIVMFYMLKDKAFFINEVRSWVKPVHWTSFQEIWRDVNHVLGGFVRGRLILTVFVGLATGLGAAVIGIPNAITIGVLAGVFDLIPYFGPWIGGVLPVVLALISPQPIKALWVVIWMAVVQQLEANILSPKILSNEVGMHPLLVIFSVLFFGALFGVLGMIIGVPVTASALALIRYFWNKAKQREHNAHPNSWL